MWSSFSISPSSGSGGGAGFAGSAGGMSFGGSARFSGGGGSFPHASSIEPTAVADTPSARAFRMKSRRDVRPVAYPRNRSFSFRSFMMAPRVGFRVLRWGSVLLRDQRLVPAQPLRRDH